MSLFRPPEMTKHHASVSKFKVFNVNRSEAVLFERCQRLIVKHLQKGGDADHYFLCGSRDELGLDFVMKVLWAACDFICLAFTKEEIEHNHDPEATGLKGFGICQTLENYVTVHAICGEGTGKVMIEHIVQSAKKAHIEFVCLTSVPKAVFFYRKQHFQNRVFYDGQSFQNIPCEQKDAGLEKIAKAFPEHPDKSQIEKYAAFKKFVSALKKKKLTKNTNDPYIIKENKKLRARGQRINGDLFYMILCTDTIDTDPSK